MVLATVVPNIRKAMKLKNAAHRTAWEGFNTLVETTVATELAASCMPLVKSKDKASRMMAAIKNMLEFNLGYYSI